jgi:hypothetical protein
LSVEENADLLPSPVAVTHTHTSALSMAWSTLHDIF